jgi:Calcineurin-like phosphoesterase
MLFQFMSDLHLEIAEQYVNFKIPPVAPCLILAGDIGRLQDYEPLAQFLEIQCANFERVLHVPGNHEFYGSTRERGLERAMHLQRDPRLRTRLTILSRSRVDLTDDLTILGCTLQSHITPACEQIVKSKIQDFRKIADWTTTDHNDEHRRDLAWLKAEVEEIRDSERDGNSGTIIVITHHAPIRKGSSRTEHEQNP